MSVVALIIALGFAYVAAVLILGVMAVRLDDSHKFVKLIIDTRRLRRQYEAPLAANGNAGGPKSKKVPDDEIWPEAL